MQQADDPPPTFVREQSAPNTPRGHLQKPLIHGCPPQLPGHLRAPPVPDVLHGPGAQKVGEDGILPASSEMRREPRDHTSETSACTLCCAA